MKEHVLLQISDSIAAIILNEPETRNALSSSIKDSLLEKLDIVKASPDIKGVVLTGNGSSFCAGGDLKAMLKSNDAFSIKTQMKHTVEIIEKIQNLHKPVIAAVNGYAAGAGFALALACDIVVAEKDATFYLSFQNVGLVPDLGLHHFLLTVLGPWKTKQLIWSGEKISAEQGQAYGFVNKIVDKDATEHAMAFVRQLLTGPVQAYGETKAIINESLKHHLQPILEMENNVQSILRTTNNHQEGVLAFQEKRKPEFQ